MYAYIASKGGRLAQYYFTALGRERYSMYKTNNNPELLKVNFITEETYSGEIQPYGLGDLNYDGSVNNTDLTMLSNHVGAIELITDTGILSRCDINQDGEINLVDLMQLLNYVGN